MRDFNVPVTIEGVATVREPDGLALSSRNQRLTPDERPLAPSLYAALSEARRQVEGGRVGPCRDQEKRRTPGFRHDERVRLEYLELVDPDDFQPVRTHRPARSWPQRRSGSVRHG